MSIIFYNGLFLTTEYYFRYHLFSLICSYILQTEKDIYLYERI